MGLTMSLTGNLSDDRMNWHVLQVLKGWSSQISTKPVTWVCFIRKCFYRKVIFVVGLVFVDQFRIGIKCICIRIRSS